MVCWQHGHHTCLQHDGVSQVWHRQSLLPGLQACTACEHAQCNTTTGGPRTITQTTQDTKLHVSIAAIEMQCSAATTTTTHICKCRQQHSKARASQRPSCLGMLLAARPPHLYATCHPHGDTPEVWHHHPPHGNVCWEAGPSACPPGMLNCQRPPPPCHSDTQLQQHSTNFRAYHFSTAVG
jgi:hypothetical protein